MKVLTILAVTVLLLCAADPSGARVSVACVFYNNAHEFLEIEQFRNELSTEKAVHYSVPPGGIVKIRDWEGSTFTFISNTRSWIYRNVPPTWENESEYLDFVKYVECPYLIKKKLACPIIRAQLEPDGRVFVLGLEQGMPAAEFASQPEGYPLAPNSE